MLEGLRIAFIAGTLGQGGAERQLYYILRTLKENGAQAIVLSLTRGEYWEPRIRNLGIPVIWVGQASSRPVRLARIVRELHRIQIDIVQSQHFYTNLYAALAARILNIREIGAIRGDGTSDVQANGRWTGLLCLRIPRVLAANSWAGIRNAVRMGVSPEHLFFLPNAVDTEYFHPSPHDHRREICLLIVGRLTTVKRIDRFLCILARLRSQSKIPVLGLIVGDGPLRSALEQQAQELGLLPYGVNFQGRVTDMRPFYQKADILVLTSDWEGTPNVVLEAMACGLPIVSTRVGDVPDLVQRSQAGCLFSSIEEGVCRLLELIVDRDMREAMGRAAREYVMKHHRVSVLREALSDLYQKVL